MKWFVRCILLSCLVFAAFGYRAFAQSAAGYDALIQQGKAQLQASHPDQALATAEQAIKLDAKNWEGYALAGGALMNLRRYDDAINRLTDAIERAPQDKEATLSALRKQCFAHESGSGDMSGAPAIPTMQSLLPAQAASPPQPQQAVAAPSSPPVHEILDWISRHLVTDYDAPLSPGLTKSESTKAHITTGMVHEGCTVFYVLQTHNDYVKTSSGKSQDTDDSSDSYILDLSQAIPDNITVAANSKDGEIDLTIPFSGKMPHLSTDFSSVEDSMSTSGYDFVDKLIIGFTTQEMADRQAKAWRDAIVGCQQQAAPVPPDNLY